MNALQLTYVLSQCTRLTDGHLSRR